MPRMIQQDMKALIFSLLLLCIICDRVLVVLDNRNLENTHSRFLDLLRNKGKNNVEIAYSFGSQAIQLKYYDQHKYEHIVILGTSDKDTQSQIKTRDIVSYFDEGGNVIVIADVDCSLSYRKMFQSFGLDLDGPGTQLKDHFSNHESSTLLATSNYEPISPFFVGGQQRVPLLYKGVGMTLVNYQNYQLYNLIKAEPTTFSKNYQTGQAVRAGTTITLAAGVQGLNNARALLFGSTHFFSNAVFQTQNFGNQQVAQGLLGWVLRKRGVVRISSMSYHGDGVDHKETLFNVGEKLYFSADVEEYDDEVSSWRPYMTNDMQVELVMLDPWVRTSLVKGQGSSYVAEFYAPPKEGIYQFKINYRKPGFNFIKEAERVTIRPYKHNQFPRFLFVAYPYFLGTFSTIAATFLFILYYLYSSVSKQKTE